MKTRMLRGNVARVTALLAVAFVMLLAGGAIASQAAPSTPITLTVIGPAQPVSLGQSFLVTIRADQASNLGAFEFGVAFNQGVLSTNPDWMALTPFLGSTGRSTGELRLENPTNLTQPVFGAYSYGAASGPTGNGDLATIQFLAVAPGVSSIALSQVQVTDAEANVTLVNVVPGNVTVTQTTSTRRLFLPMLLRRR